VSAAATAALTSHCGGRGDGRGERGGDRAGEHGDGRGDRGDRGGRGGGGGGGSRDDDRGDRGGRGANGSASGCRPLPTLAQLRAQIQSAAANDEPPPRSGELAAGSTPPGTAAPAAPLFTYGDGGGVPPVAGVSAGTLIGAAEQLGPLDRACSDPVMGSSIRTGKPAVVRKLMQLAHQYGCAAGLLGQLKKVGKGFDFGQGVWWVKAASEPAAAGSGLDTGWSDQMLAWIDHDLAWNHYKSKLSRDKTKQKKQPVVQEEPAVVAAGAVHKNKLECPKWNGWMYGSIFEHPTANDYDPDFETIVMIVADTHGSANAAPCVSANCRSGNGAGKDGRDWDAVGCPRQTGLGAAQEDRVWYRAKCFAKFAINHWLWPLGSTADHDGACGAARATFDLAAAQLLSGVAGVRDLYEGTLEPSVDGQAQPAFEAIEFCEAAMGSAALLREAAAVAQSGNKISTLPVTAAQEGLWHYYTRALKLEPHGSRAAMGMAEDLKYWPDEVPEGKGYGSHSRTSNPGTKSQAHNRAAKLLTACDDFLGGVDDWLDDGMDCEYPLVPLLVYGGAHKYNTTTPRRKVIESDSFALRAGQSAASALNRR
jgi:hypothetical protein